MAKKVVVKQDEFKQDWDWAKAWQDTANIKSDEVPQWIWDCSFKLDYDSGLFSVSSRFYPPIGHYGKGWNGEINFYFLGKKIKHLEKELQCEALQELKKETEKYVKHVADIIKSRIINL